MTVLRKIWAFYGILVFMILWILVLPVSILILLLFPKKGPAWLTWFNHHVFTSIFFGMTLIRVKVRGRKKLKRGQSYIIVSNHRSSIDFMANAFAFPGIYRYLAKKELAKIPIFGFVVKKFCVLVDRSSTVSRAKSIVYLKKVLEEGVSVFLYPEGTRNTGEEPLGKFQTGAFRLAVQTGKPIAVQTITNISKVTSPRNAAGLWPGTLKIVWDEPIETKGLSNEDVPKLVEQVRELMTGHLISEQEALEIAIE